MMESYETKVYAVKHKDGEVIKQSSSGGLFTALSDYFINTGNAVASCIYNNETDRVEFEIYTSRKKRDEARGSKYIQAHIGNGFIDVINWLKNNPNKIMLSIGTGCQMDGLRKLLEVAGLRKRVVLVDLICHGATSPGLWQIYTKYIDCNGRIERISFKDKRNGWHNPTLYVKVDGKEKSINSFAEWFYGQWAIRESCYCCPYTQVDRKTDLTIGDYWGIETVLPDFSDLMGVSLLLVHSENGNKIFEQIKSDIEYEQTSREQCLQPRLLSPAKRPRDRQGFWNDIESKGLSYCEKKYVEKNNSNLFIKVKRRLKNIVKHFLKEVKGE